MIGKRFKELRKQLKLNQTDFGNRVGVSQAAITHIEKGDNPPGQQTVTLICSIYNVNRAWLETGKGAMFLPPEPETCDLKPATVVLPSRADLILADSFAKYSVGEKTINEAEEIRNMVEALLEILTSRNKIVKEAIKSNLVAFQHTVQSDEKLEATTNDILDLRKEIEELKRVSGQQGRDMKRKKV